jgi:alpha-L-arabinofuranosidase
MTKHYSRRKFLTVTTAVATTAVSAFSRAEDHVAVKEQAPDPALLSINPAPRFDLSPYLYMQFMEPLGVTDGSVEAAWDSAHDRWRDDFLEVSRRLAPPLMRWGGCFSSYYRWKEAVGPRRQRVPMENLLWGGWESNQIGTAEFVDFCRQVGADALMCVNFEGDGRKQWAASPHGSVRTAGPEEAAAWVDYCNNPNNADRVAHGMTKPCTVPIWQIGNETSYDSHGFDRETAARKTLEFAKAMRKADPKITLIGWGDSGWAKRMIEIAGEQLQYIAFHHHPGAVKGSPLQGTEYRKDPAKTWHYLMEGSRQHDERIRAMREETAGSGIPLALTESHFALPGPNRCAVLSTWAAGVAMARFLNVHSRHGDVLKIATAADFCGTRWTNNAIMIPVPRGNGKAFMMPVARAMALFRANVGKKAVSVTRTPAELDVTASRSGDRIYVHVVNTDRTRAAAAQFAVDGMRIRSSRVMEISADPEFEVWSGTAETLAPKQRKLANASAWTFPAASVSAVELECEAT